MKILIIANTSWYIYNFRLPFLKAFQQKKIEIVILAPKDKFTEKLKDLNLKFINLPLDRKNFFPLKELRTFFKLFQTIKTEKPDFIINYTPKPMIYGSLFSKFFQNSKVINVVTGLGFIFSNDTPVLKLLNPVIEIIYRFAFSKTYKVFFQNPDDRDFFVEKSIVSQEKTVVTFGSGVDLEHFSYCEPALLKKNLTFILVARMLRNKGILEFVQAARIIKKNYPETKFQLLGPIDPGNPRGIGLDLIENWQKEEMIEYLGKVPDVRPFISEADVVVLPSYYREGVPKSLLEALALGKPIVTTDWYGCKETVLHGENGFLIPIKDSTALADAFEIFLTNPELCSKMGKKSRTLAVQKFDVEKVNSLFFKAMNLEN
ncbi:glycosyltransferase family 4 protein [bacterium]|nr:glycosyltransferase family 4 protein [bacterium]